MKAQILGRIANQEFKATSGGMDILNFSIAENYRKKQGDQWIKEVSFFNCVAFGKTAANINQYFKKGDGIFLHVDVRQERWEKDGQNRSAVKLYVNGFEFLPSKTGQGSDAAEDDDIPF